MIKERFKVLHITQNRIIKHISHFEMEYCQLILHTETYRIILADQFLVFF